MELSVDDICKLLNVSRATVFRVLKDGRLKSRQIEDVFKYALKKDRRATAKRTVTLLKKYGWLRKAPNKSSGNVERKHDPWKLQSK
jgi:hypothetical protein